MTQENKLEELIEIKMEHYRKIAEIRAEEMEIMKEMEKQK